MSLFFLFLEERKAVAPIGDKVLQNGEIFCPSVRQSVIHWIWGPHGPESWRAQKEAWLNEPKAWLAGPEACLAGPEAWLAWPEALLADKTVE